MPFVKLEDQQTVWPSRSGEMARSGLEQRIANYLHIRQISGVDALRIEFACGTAVVRGPVTSETVKRRICECCRHVAGVLNVVDRLEVSHLHERAKE